MGQSPLFQVVFSLDNTPTARIDLGPDVTACAVATNTGTADFDLALFMRQNENHLTGTLGYSTALFNGYVPHRIPTHFGKLIKEISLEPGKRLSQIQIMPDDERHFVIGKHGVTQDTPGTCTTIHALFEEQAARRPDSPAVIYKEGLLSYRELNHQADRLADNLRARGVGPEVLVGICMTRSPEMLVGILAVLKAGGAYLPLNPHHPRRRLELILEDAGIQLLLTQGGTAAQSTHTNTLTVKLEQPIIQRQEVAPPTALAKPSNLAYVIYTSGSTGPPNGVMVEHKSLVSRIQALARLFDFHAEDRQLHLLSPTFDAACEEIFLPLAVGAAIVLPPGDKTLSIDEFLSICDDSGVTKVNMPSSYWHELVDALIAANRSLPPTIRLVGTGAESPSHRRLIEWIPRVRSDLQFYNIYGPTETTIAATACRIPLDLEKISHWTRIPIGRPIEETDIYILDRYLQPVPIGIPGEIHIGGIGLARGYLNRPSLTKEKFIPNPFSDEANARLYKTGDLARYLLDGNIEFLGRGDRQVKIRGHRIELREIELAIESHPLVKSCHASTSTLAEDDVRLVAGQAER
jgi:amino acid adenylation domain-containing protein